MAIMAEMQTVDLADEVNDVSAAAEMSFHQPQSEYQPTTTTTTTSAPRTSSSASLLPELLKSLFRDQGQLLEELGQPSPEEEALAANTVQGLMSMVRYLPLELRKKMLSQMMLTVPVAAATMATVGVPNTLIAPLAAVIPGFVGAAFSLQEKRQLQEEHSALK